MNTILFDLDGTLLPMDQEKFVTLYFGALARYMKPLGFDPDQLVKSIWACTKKTLEGQEGLSNEEVFWNSYGEIYGSGALRFKADFDRFYETEFSAAKKGTWQHPGAGEMIQSLKGKGYRLVIATNPVFPRVATYARIGWAGLSPEDFAWITTYENSHYCKPDIRYYEEILQTVGAAPTDCLMVGNDVTEDMCAGTIGMETILLTDTLLNKTGEDIGGFSCMNFEQLALYFEGLPAAQSSI